MALQWHGDEAIQRTRQALAEGLVRAAIHFENAHRQALSTSYPPASAVGQYPHGRTWALRDAVTHEPTDLAAVAKALKVRIGYPVNVAYGLILERKRGRLGLLTTLERVRGQLRELIGGGR